MQLCLCCVILCARVCVCVHCTPVYLDGVEKLRLLTVATKWQVGVKFIFPLFYCKYSSGLQGTQSTLESENTGGYLKAEPERGGWWWGWDEAWKCDLLSNCHNATLVLISAFSKRLQHLYDEIPAYWWIKTLYTHHKTFPLKHLFIALPQGEVCEENSSILRFTHVCRDWTHFVLCNKWLSFCLNH